AACAVKVTADATDVPTRETGVDRMLTGLFGGVCRDIHLRSIALDLKHHGIKCRPSMRGHPPGGIGQILQNGGAWGLTAHGATCSDRPASRSGSRVQPLSPAHSVEALIVVPTPVSVSQSSTVASTFCAPNCRATLVTRTTSQVRPSGPL